MTHGLDGKRLLGPKLPIVNPPLWEFGHLAWFQEFWCLRYRADGPPRDSILAKSDALFDSAKVAHATRWSLPLPSLKDTRTYQADVLGLVLRRLQAEPEDAGLRYFVQLAAFHEDMHTEAFHYSRQTLGYADPYTPAEGKHTSFDGSQDVAIAGGPFLLGALPTDGFVFDNEKWAHEIEVAPFRMAKTALTNAEYKEFVESGGYLRREFWSEAGWAWREVARAEAPRYWIRDSGSWRLRRFDCTILLPLDHPVIHVNWHEAEAYCRFARRRLPTEAEWECAAATGTARAGKSRYPWGESEPEGHHANLQSSTSVGVSAFPGGDSADGCRQLIGNVWEWTASPFEPYPGFVMDPYKEYSQPWFGTNRVLRGGSFATPRGLIRNTWRNFYTPDRGDIFAGFRTCAAD